MFAKIDVSDSEMAEIEISFEAAKGQRLNVNKILNDESDEDYMFVMGEYLNNQTSFVARFYKDDLSVDWITELDARELNEFSPSNNVEDSWLGCGLSQTDQAIFFSINSYGELTYSYDLGDSDFKNSSC
eukprot:CAMPEP_0116879944 /NCGR_PEP_ID=MMETSP0463-20121206/11799_1 /TAXON_ID=181622 /ORGANISM="Strombidinopsis sp, Strain SopsisLIS2011" /LENGTH=128 /DNA_ID=CAMNT_0004529881 /DNA_START=526 /DNA_END=912 /DNA_ORIENTATION=+